ncbi:MAG TPA: hypothetical protein VH858_07210 [Hyphomicrobiales bacterium]|jgi:hypothetical protein
MADDAAGAVNPGGAGGGTGNTVADIRAAGDRFAKLMTDLMNVNIENQEKTMPTKEGDKIVSRSTLA